jgi:hypothetical protein
VAADGDGNRLHHQGDHVLEGYYGTLAYQACMAAQSLPNRWILWRVLLALLARQMTRAELKKKSKWACPRTIGSSS